MINNRISPEERQTLYEIILSELGASQRQVELTEKDMDVAFLTSMEDYATEVNNWLIEDQWGTLQNMDLSSEDVALGYITRSLNYEKRFTYAYGKQVGLGANGPSEWELKRDFITVVQNQQVYSIPAGREINEILWYTPSQVMLTAGLGGGAGEEWIAGPFGWSHMGRPAQFMLPSFTMLLGAQDRSLKKHLMGSDLTYRITPGPAGTKNLFLYPIPGSGAEISNWSNRHREGDKVWYFYYDTNLGDINTPINDDSLIKFSHDVPLENFRWEELNTASKKTVRDLFLAKCKKVLGGIRGKFSGVVNAGDMSVTLDYRMLLDEGERDRENILAQLREHLQKISWRAQLQDRADAAENLNRILRKQPFKKGWTWK